MGVDYLYFTCRWPAVNTRWSRQLSDMKSNILSWNLDSECQRHTHGYQNDCNLLPTGISLIFTKFRHAWLLHYQLSQFHPQSHTSTLTLCLHIMFLVPCHLTCHRLSLLNIQSDSCWYAQHWIVLLRSYNFWVEWRELSYYTVIFALVLYSVTQFSPICGKFWK